MNAYDETVKAQTLAAYHERGFLRAMKRIFGVPLNTVMAWLKITKKAATLSPSRRHWRRLESVTFWN